MKSRFLLVQSVLLTLAVALFVSAPQGGSALQERTIDLTYTADIHDIPAGAKQVDIWLPYPRSDAYQKILKATVSSPFATKRYFDLEYGNEILFVSVKNPTTPTIQLSMRFEVRRVEHVNRNFGGPAEARDPPAARLKRWLESDRRVPLDHRIRELALQVTKGQNTDVEKARAIYDYVIATMRYDKTGTGWGEGDIYWACDAKRGNCTDFHALFIGLCRAVGIPAKFEIGLPLPPNRASGEVTGYHCWSEFYLRGAGWVPVDASEAWKNPSRRYYFFGAHDANRVQFSIGRDIELAPPQAGPALNFFIYPYVEVDGKQFNLVDKKFFFRDISVGAVAAGEK